jgi:transcriptional regulator with XRE-family HTH domain
MVNARVMQATREARGMTRYALAKKAGVPQQTVSDIEQYRQRYPNLKTLVRIADALEISIKDLVIDKENA